MLLDLIIKKNELDTVASHQCQLIAVWNNLNSTNALKMSPTRRVNAAKLVKLNDFYTDMLNTNLLSVDDLNNCLEHLNHMLAPSSIGGLPNNYLSTLRNFQAKLINLIHLVNEYHLAKQDLETDLITIVKNLAYTLCHHYESFLPYTSQIVEQACARALEDFQTQGLAQNVIAPNPEQLVVIDLHFNKLFNPTPHNYSPDEMTLILSSNAQEKVRALYSYFITYLPAPYFIKLFYEEFKSAFLAKENEITTNPSYS